MYVTLYYTASRHSQEKWNCYARHCYAWCFILSFTSIERVSEVPLFGTIVKGFDPLRVCSNCRTCGDRSRNYVHKGVCESIGKLRKPLSWCFIHRPFCPSGKLTLYNVVTWKLLLLQRVSKFYCSLRTGAIYDDSRSWRIVGIKFAALQKGHSIFVQPVCERNFH